MGDLERGLFTGEALELGISVHRGPYGGLGERLIYWGL